MVTLLGYSFCYQYPSEILHVDLWPVLMDTPHGDTPNSPTLQRATEKNKAKQQVANICFRLTVPVYTFTDSCLDNDKSSDTVKGDCIRGDGSSHPFYLGSLGAYSEFSSEPGSTNFLGSMSILVTVLMKVQTLSQVDLRRPLSPWIGKPASWFLSPFLYASKPAVELLKYFLRKVCNSYEDRMLSSVCFSI